MGHIFVKLWPFSRHIFANPALYEATGLSAEQYLGKTNEEIGLPEHLCLFWKEKHDAVFKTGQPLYFEFNFHAFDKGERVFHTSVCPEFNVNKEVKSIISFMRDITELKEEELEKNRTIEALEKALAEVKTLQGLIPICMYCKGIRDDKGYWNQLEEYFSKFSDIEFSHGICEKCAKERFPDYIK